MSDASVKDALVKILAGVGTITVAAVTNHAPDESGDTISWGDSRSYALRHIYREIPLAIGPVDTPFVAISVRAVNEEPVAGGAETPVRKANYRVLVGLTVLSLDVFECSRVFDALIHEIRQAIRDEPRLNGYADVANESVVISAMDMATDVTDPEPLDASVVQRGVVAVTVSEYRYA